MLTVEKIIQQQALKNNNRVSGTIREQDNAPSLDPVFQMLHKTGKANIGAIKIVEI